MKKQEKRVWNSDAKNWMAPKKKKKQKKIKSLPDKPIPMGGGPFVGRHTTG